MTNRQKNDALRRSQHELQETMQSLAGIVRTEAELQQALAETKKLRSRAESVSAPGNREYNPGWHTALDLRNLFLVAEAIARSGLSRKESRGAHFRADYPQKESAFEKSNFIVRKNASGGMDIQEEPLSEIRPDLRAIIEEMG